MNNYERNSVVCNHHFMGIIGILFTLYVIYVSMTAMNTGAWVVLVLYIAMAVPFWAYAKNKQKTDPENWTPIVISPDNFEEHK